METAASPKGKIVVGNAIFVSDLLAWAKEKHEKTNELMRQKFLEKFETNKWYLGYGIVLGKRDAFQELIEELEEKK